MDLSERPSSDALTSSSEVAPCPLLPIELVREVVELEALADRSSAVTLALVCKDVQSWVTPFIYRTVSLETREDILSFIRSVEAAQCASVDNTRHVCSLAIHRYAMQHCDWTLSLCRDVQRLLLWPTSDPPPGQPVDDSVEGVSLWPRPWYVVVLEVHISWFTRRMTLFTHTTHLYVDEVLNTELLQLCTMMPLTHICFGFWGDQEYREEAIRGTQVLLNMQSMEIVLIHAFISGVSIDDFYGGIWRSLANIADERLYVMPGMLHEELFEIFESGKTVWDSVEEWTDWRQRVLAA